MTQSTAVPAGQTPRPLDPRQWTLGTRLIVSGLILIGLVLLLTLVTYRRVVEERRQAEVENALVIARTMAVASEAFVRDVEGTVQALTFVLGRQAGPSSQEEAGPILRAVFDKQGVLRTLFLTDDLGRVVASYSGREIGLDLSNRPYLQALRQGAPTVWSGRLAGVQTGQVTVAYGAAVRYANGARGYLVAAFYPAVVLERLPLTIPQDARVTIVDRNAGLLYTNQEAALQGRIDFSQAADVRRALAGETVVLRIRRGASTGEARYGAIVPIPRTGWGLSFTRPLAPLEARLRDQFIRQTAAVGAVFLLAALAIVLLVSRILRPVTTLSQVSSAIARGDRPPVPSVAGPPEVRRLAEGMAAMSQAVMQRETALQRAEEAQRFLAEASTALASSLDAQATLRHAARLVVPRLADWCVVHMVDEDGTLRRVEVAHVDQSLEERVKEFASRYPPDPENLRSPATYAIRNRQTVFVREITDDWLRAAAPDEETYRFAAELHLRSLLVIPLLARERTVGAITFVMADSGRTFGATDVGLAEELARRVAVAVDNARLYDRERLIAHTLQQASLPRDLPAMPGVALQGAYVADAVRSEVGGDWYDAFWLRDGRIAISVGDVAGRGLEAAVAMGQIRQGIRMAAFEDARPSKVLARVERLLQSTLPEEMVTAVFGVLDPTARTFTYANAGHLPPILAMGEDRVEVLEARGLPLGFGMTRERADAVVAVEPGALLILYTDGLTEATHDPVSGQDVLLNAMRDEVRAPSDDRAAALLRRALGETVPHDDVALLAVSLAAGPVDRFNLTLPAIPSALPLIRQSVRQVGLQLGLPGDRAVELEIAVGEAVNNVIEHAYGVVPGMVRVHGGLEGGVLVVTVEDDGRWRGPTGSPHTSRGLVIMRALVDEVKVESTLAGTRVRLAVRPGSAAPPEPGRELAKG